MMQRDWVERHQPDISNFRFEEFGKESYRERKKGGGGGVRKKWLQESQIYQMHHCADTLKDKTKEIMPNLRYI
jgi:hypothetical protein